MPRTATDGESEGSEFPVLSIVTVHLDDWSGLASTMASVLESEGMTGLSIEWVVIDGASKPPADPTLLPRIREIASVFISEPDLGIFDAMNKGTAHCTGVYVLYLNAGDLLLAEGAEAFARWTDGAAESAVILFDAKEGVAPAGYQLKSTRSADSVWYGMPTHHQAMVFRRQELPSPPYDTSFKIGADYDLICRLYARGISFDCVHIAMCAFDLTGVSSARYFEGLQEQWRIRRRTLGMNWVNCAGVHLLRVLARIFRLGAPGFYDTLRYSSKRPNA